MNACSALWLTPSRTRTKCTRGGCRPDAKACANAAAAASKSAWLTFEVSVAFELGQTTPLHAQNTQNMPLRHEGATVLLASRPHQSAHIALCCVAADKHDAFAFHDEERERFSRVASFLRTVTCISSPPSFNRAWNWGSCMTRRALLSGSFEVKTSDCSRQANLRSDAYSSQSTPNAHPMDRAPDVLTARIDRSLHAQASTRAQSSSTAVGRKS
jgi:hypothetical protein